jgi:hypothetical protein
VCFNVPVSDLPRHRWELEQTNCRPPHSLCCDTDVFIALRNLVMRDLGHFICRAVSNNAYRK